MAVPTPNIPNLNDDGDDGNSPIEKLFSVSKKYITNASQQSRAKQCLEVLLDTMEGAGITDSAQKAFFIAIAHGTSLLGNQMTESITEEEANKNRSGKSGNGEQESGDAYRYRGRGFIRLNGKSDYEKWGKRLGFDFITKPELAAELRIAAKIMILGIKEGSISGSKGTLADYINGSKRDFANANKWMESNEDKSLNGKNQQIVKFAEAYYEALLS
ncbi:MAG: hypothetical protein KDK45_05425 [Leptospiraceae bacterium]|nr:hypothetical protein [Leptospiraceae bacterium]